VIRSWTTPSLAVQIFAGIAPETLRIYVAYGRIPLHHPVVGEGPARGGGHVPRRGLAEVGPGPDLRKEKQYPMSLAAANPDASLDVLHYLVQQWPAHFFRRGRPWKSNVNEKSKMMLDGYLAFTVCASAGLFLSNCWKL
jgi:hypothetical protein